MQKIRLRKYCLLITTMLVILLSFHMKTVVLAASTYYVSLDGSDSNKGSKTAPFKTIQKAVDTAKAGSTVYIMKGTYYERITMNNSGSGKKGAITIRNYGKDKVILDGSKISLDDQESIIYINNKSYIKIIGLEIRNNICSSTSFFPKGIEITGYGNNVILKDIVVHDIKNKNTTKDSGANGIGVYGTHKTKPITNLRIENVEIYNCVLGQSETLCLNGNVDGFTVTGCNIHDNDNIGICTIGYEGTCSTERYDQARNGVVSNNKVTNCSSYSNPTYTDLAADGIYSDGSRNNIFCNNIVTGCDIGMEAGSEHPGKISSNIIIRNNLIYNNKATGISIGGYDTSVGWTIKSKIYNNTLYNNDTSKKSRKEIDICKGYDNIIKNNIIFCNDENDIIGNSFSKKYSYNNTIDYNIYYGPSGSKKAEWEWKNVTYQGFLDYKKKTKQDAHSQFVNPQFINASKYNFYLKKNSNAINMGDPKFKIASGEKDLNGTNRKKNGRIDCGAYEY